MPNQPLHLDLVPMDLAWNDPKENLKRMEGAISEALSLRPELPSESRIFVFPELALTGFITENPGASALERTGGPVQGVRELARKFKTAILAGFPERVDGQEKPSNTALLVSPEGEDLADYQKLHLYTAGKTPESRCYERGLAGSLMRYRDWKIGLAICFDLRFPALFQAYAREQADLVILPACWLGGPGKSEQFSTLAKARAIEGQCFFAALNRSGTDPNACYEGEALCFGPKGQSLASKAGYDLDPILLDEARSLSVRPSDLEEYPILVQS